jgi:hypothetical protein
MVYVVLMSGVKIAIYAKGAKQQPGEGIASLDPVSSTERPYRSLIVLLAKLDKTNPLQRGKQ